MSDDYVKAVEEMRIEKDRAFTTPHSPLPHAERRGFQGLEYYPPDPKYRFVVRLVRHENPALVNMATSTGEAREYLNLGHFELDVDGTNVALQAYWNEGSPSLFVPFRDKTSGKETYGAGRYLDIEWEGPDAEYVVDLNLAYNPLCAYDEAYSCPFPPPENWLQVRIEAGEKNYKTYD